MATKLKKTNPNLAKLVVDLKRWAKERDAPVWKDTAERLSNPRRGWAQVNLSRIERYAGEGETVLVPGKLLGSGNIRKPLTIAAFKASQSAVSKVKEAGGRFLSIRDLALENPTGTGVRIMG